MLLDNFMQKFLYDDIKIKSFKSAFKALCNGKNSRLKF